MDSSCRLPDAALVSIVGRPPRPLIIDVVRGLDGARQRPLPARRCASRRRRAGRLEAHDGVAAYAAGIAPSGTTASTRIRGSFRRAMRRRWRTCRRPPAAGARKRAQRGRTAARFVPGELPGPGHPASARAHTDGGGLGRPTPRVVLLSGARTERWWDISIETLKDYRRHGYAARAVRAMTRHMWQTGRSPVWGSTIDNTPRWRSREVWDFRKSDGSSCSAGHDSLTGMQVADRLDDNRPAIRPHEQPHEQPTIRNGISGTSIEKPTIRKSTQADDQQDRSEDREQQAGDEPLDEQQRQQHEPDRHLQHASAATTIPVKSTVPIIPSPINSSIAAS